MSFWERIWEQNTAKPARISGMWRNRPDACIASTCGFETLRTVGHSWCVAHNPEVAGSNPVPATKESGPDQAKRPPASAGGRFVLRTLVNERRSLLSVRTRSEVVHKVAIAESSALVVSVSGARVRMPLAMVAI
jgi:hypothetical protein